LICPKQRSHQEKTWRSFPEAKGKANTVHNILRNPIYIGKVRWGGDEADGIHQPIVEKDIFELVQGKLSANRTWTKRYESPNNFLGIVYCGLCKSPMHIHYPGNENKRRYKYYVCSQRLSYKTCEQEYIRADISWKLKEIEVDRESLYDWVLKNRPTEKGTKFLNRKLEEIDSEKNLLKKRLWEIEDKVNGIKTEDLNVEIITNYLETFMSTYDGLELGEKKMLLESLIQRADINKAKNVKLTLQIPLEKFRVFIPDLSPKCRKTQNRIFYLGRV